MTPGHPVPPGGAVHPGAGVRVCVVPGAAILLRGDACNVLHTALPVQLVVLSVMQTSAAAGEHVAANAGGTGTEQICMEVQNMKGMFTNENEVC
jgi:hypothetical protein